MSYLSGWGMRSAVALAVLCGGRVLGATPATLVDPQLRGEPIAISTLHDGVLVYFDAEHRLRKLPVDQFVQLRDIGADAPVGLDAGAIELVDGQRLIGRWLRADPAGQSFRWEHPTFGQIVVPIDDLVTMTLAGDPLADDGSGQDIVLLNNGDTLRGFIAAIEPGGLSITPEGASEAVILPMDHVSAVRLANSPAPVAPGLNRVLLRDGSRLFARRIELLGDEARFETTLPGRPVEAVTLPVDAVVRIDFTATGVRLLELARQPMTVIAGGAVFGLRVPPRIDAEMIGLHAPVTVAFDVPETASHFAATAELVDARTGTAGLMDWADCEVVVRHGESGQEQRYRLNGRSPRVEINVAIEPAPRLVIEVDPGINGPVLDRVRLRDAVLLDRNAYADDLSEAAGW